MIDRGAALQCLTQRAVGLHFDATADLKAETLAAGHPLHLLKQGT
jgi:hypothetical protein